MQTNLPKLHFFSTFSWDFNHVRLQGMCRWRCLYRPTTDRRDAFALPKSTSSLAFDGSRWLSMDFGFQVAIRRVSAKQKRFLDIQCIQFIMSSIAAGDFVLLCKMAESMRLRYVPDEADGRMKLQINAQNCVHCKCCSIKTPQDTTGVCEFSSLRFYSH